MAYDYGMDQNSDAWLAATEIEAAVSFAHNADLLLGESLSDPEKRRAFGPRSLTNRVVNWHMRDVTLAPAKALVFKGNTVVEQTRFGLNPGEEHAARESLRGPHVHLNGRRAFVGLNRFCANYFHLLTQVVPAIAGYQADPGFQDGLLLLGAPGPPLYRALELAGVSVPETLVIARMPPMDVEDLTFSNLLTSHGDSPSMFSRSVFDRMIERAAKTDGGFAPLIYISRVDSKMRPMRNEDELMQRLIRHGVEPVVLSELSLDEQIELFNNTRVVIGPHGGGLANLVFSRPGTVVYELLPDNWVNPCMNQLAQLRGLHYWCDVYRAEPRPGLWHHHTPWTVDIDTVERRLREIILAYDLHSAGR